jgi:hypothetical protein
MKTRITKGMAAACFAVFCLAQAASAQVTVLTVPFDPTNPTTPHTTYPNSATTEVSIILMATVPSAAGSTDKFTYSWNFGDGSAATTPAAVTNPYDISVTHQYPASAGTGTQWTAVVTVTDTTTNQTGSANYYVIQEPKFPPANASNLEAQVSSTANVAIDWGLAYLHRTMWRNGTNPNTGTAGGWDTQNYNCTNLAGDTGTYACLSYGSIDAENVQAFEVNGHLPYGPATDPYTDDVQRGLARMFTQLAVLTLSNSTTVSYTYNPAKASFTCADGSVPTTTAPTCAGHGGQYFYNPSATSCTGPPCVYKFDANNNSKAIYSNDNSGEPIYTTSPFLEAVVAACNNPAAPANYCATATAPTGPTGIVGESFQNIIQDMLDYYAYSQYGGDCDVSTGYYRGYAGSCSGGGWLYDPQEGDDDSTSQWAAIAFISGERGAGISIPPIVTDANNVWITNAQDVTDPKPTGKDPFAANDNAGAFGYRGSFAYSNEWGPFAVTPSGMVQMAMDGVGRTTNTAFGDASTSPDQRWNNTETFLADNFCNSVTTYGNGGSSNAYYAPRSYMYGLYSFTKGMLLHDPGFEVSPINYLRTLTPNVFTTNTSVPANTIDWYGALSASNGGTDPCDGVAQTLVSYQQNPSSGVADGHWFGYDYYGTQSYYETAWALIMLKRTVIGPCATLAGSGSASGSAPARIDLSWSNQADSTSYNVLRGATSGGPYTLIGSTTSTAYSDTSGLSNGKTYFYVLEPLNGPIEVCQSNQAAITVPVPAGGRH